MSAMIVGRDSELAALDAALGALDAGASSAVLLAGEPGLGKTTVLAALRERADSHRITVLAGRSSVLGGGVAFAPVGGALARHLDTLPERERTDLVAGLPALARVVGGLGEPAADDLVAAADPLLVRARLFQSVALLVARLSRDRPVLLVVDDLHWAEPATVELLGHLADELASLPVGLALAYRPGDLAHRRDVRQLLADLGRRSGTLALILEPLADHELAAVAAAALGGPVSARLADAIARRAAGVPLVADAIARDLRARRAARRAGGAWDADATDLDVPHLVRDLFADRVDRLPAPARLVLAGLAVTDRPTAVTDVAAVTGLAEAATVDAVRSLADLGLIRAAEPGGERHEVAHPLVAHAVVDRLPEGDRRSLHAGWSERLRAAGASFDEVAAHVEAAGDGIGADVAVSTLASAGEQAVARGAGAEALRWTSAALERARAAGVEPRRLGALLGTASAAWELEGEVTAAAAAEREAADVLAGVHPARASRAAARAAVLDWLRGVDDDVDRWGDRAVELAGGAEPLDRLRAEYERCYMRFRRGRTGDVEGLVADFERAAAAAGDHPDVDATRFVIAASRAFHRGAPLEPLLDRIPSRRPGTSAAIHETAVGVCLEILAMLGCWDDLGTLAADESGWRSTWARLDAAVATGRWHDADDVLTEQIRPPTRWYLAQGIVEVWLAAHRGDRPLAARRRRELAERLAAGPPGLRSYGPAATAADLAAVLALGDPVEPDRPLDAFEQAWDSMREPFIRGIHGEWLAAVGRGEDARRVAARLRAFGGPSTRVGALATRIDGLSRRDDPVEAADTLLAAADAFEAVGMPFDAARCVLDAGGDHGARLLDALAVFEGIGAEPFAARARVRLGRRAPARADRTITLTPRERRVGLLVADGLTNLEIAERLGISIRTVTSHLDHAYTKLGIGSRAALAVYVTRSADAHP